MVMSISKSLAWPIIWIILLPHPIALADSIKNLFYIKGSPNIDAATADSSLAATTENIYCQKTIPKHHDMSFMQNFYNLKKIYGTDVTFELFNFTFVDQNDGLIVLQKVQTLKLEDGIIEQIKSNCFKSLPNLEKLKLQNNKIAVIAKDAFVDLFNLRKLEMAQNRISNLDLNVFSELRMVQKIELNENPIKILNLNMFKANEHLEEVEFQNSQVKDIVVFEKCATVVWRSESLPEKKNYSPKTKLNLGLDSSIMWPVDNSFLYISALAWQDVAVVHKKLSGLDSVQTLDLSNNGITTLKSEDLGHLPNLKNLWLHGNKLQEIDYVGISKKIPVIRTVTLANNNWRCNLLSKMIPFFDQKQVNYSSPANNKTTVTGINVNGVKCVLTETDEYSEHDSLKTAQSFSIIVATCLSVLLLCLYIVNVCVSSKNRKRIRFCVYVG